MIIINFRNERYLLKAKIRDKQEDTQFLKEKYSADLVLKRKGELLFLERIPILEYEEVTTKIIPQGVPVPSEN
jgi:hypothetical protein